MVFLSSDHDPIPDVEFMNPLYVEPNSRKVRVKLVKRKSTAEGKAEDKEETNEVQDTSQETLLKEKEVYDIREETHDDNTHIKAVSLGSVEDVLEVDAHDISNDIDHSFIDSVNLSTNSTGAPTTGTVKIEDNFRVLEGSESKACEYAEDIGKDFKGQVKGHGFIDCFTTV